MGESHRLQEGEAMKYSEFLKEMEKIGWYRTVYDGNGRAIDRTAFYHYPKDSHDYDSYFWFNDIRGEGYENVLNRLRKKYPEIEVKQ